MGVKVGASEVGVYLGAEKLAGVGGSDVSNIKTSYSNTGGQGITQFTVYGVTTQRNFLLTTQKLNAQDSTEISVKQNGAWVKIGTMTADELKNTNGFTFKGTFSKANNESADIEFQLDPLTGSVDGYAMVVYD